jgi:hypothetical protein
MKCSDYKPDKIRDFSIDVFERFLTIWDETKKNAPRDWDTDIWRKANTLQAVAYFWLRCNDPSLQDVAQRLMTEAYSFYVDYLKKNDPWVDDFGWWAGFFVDLYRYTKTSPLPDPFSRKQLLDYTRYCYTKMLVNFDDKKGNNEYYTGQGGIWNHRPPDKQGVNCQNWPSEDEPCRDSCQRNTVTNAWMLNVASDLFNLTQDSDRNGENYDAGRNEYKKMADEQYTWLTTGKYGSYTPKSWELYRKSNGLLWWLPGESPGTVYWSGDEGVFLRGALAYAEVNPAKMGEIEQISKKLIDAAITQTANFGDGGAWKGFPDTQNVMHESPGTVWNNNDLATGKGVFMRLVTRAARGWSYFNDIDKDFERKFKAFVNTTAESAWCSRGEKNTTAPNWNPGFGPSQEGNQPTSGGLWPWVHQTNGFDALNAAWETS